MAEVGLKRHKGETDMAFARRAFAFIKHHFHINGHAAAHGLAGLRCGQVGLRRPVVGFARRCGPTESRPGCWAAAGRPRKSRASATSDYGQWHVKSEFFAHGVGWVPVDVSGAVGDSRGGDFVLFGNDRGDFIAMAAGQDLLLDSFVSGKQNTPLFQGVVYWWRGSGADRNYRFDELWTVRKEPLGVR